jgi:Ca-activated chloride channel family protein
VRVTSIALVRSAAGGRSRWRRRVPAALLVLGLAVLAAGAARPQVTVPQASSSATIMLAIDVSGSMCSTDVKPNRITAAEQSAGAFIKSQAGGPRVGLVAFAGTAVVLVPPTTDTQQLLTALGGLSVDGGTAIGEGILTSLDAIAQVDPSVAPTGATARRDAGAGYADDVIVVLTDGSNNRGIDPQVAAREAAQRGVRVYTIGYGTDNPAPLSCGPGQFGGFGGYGSGFGGYSGSGGGNSLGADYSALMQISHATGGTFYRAQDADELSKALGKLPAVFSIVRKRVDIAAGFAVLGGLLIAVAVALSRWQDRPRGAVARPRPTPPAGAARAVRGQRRRAGPWPWRAGASAGTPGRARLPCQAPRARRRSAPARQRPGCRAAAPRCAPR